MRRKIAPSPLVSFSAGAKGEPARIMNKSRLLEEFARKLFSRPAGVRAAVTAPRPQQLGPATGRAALGQAKLAEIPLLSSQLVPLASKPASRPASASRRSRMIHGAQTTRARLLIFKVLRNPLRPSALAPARGSCQAVALPRGAAPSALEHPAALNEAGGGGERSFPAVRRLACCCPCAWLGWRHEWRAIDIPHAI